MFRLFIAACLLPFALMAQPVSVDLSLSNNYFASATGGEVNANVLGTGQVVRLNVTIGNFVSGVAAPAGHFRLRIGLGAGLVINPGFNLANAPLNAYFNWSYDLSGAQPQIIGNSIAPLPDGFAQEVYFELKAANATTSTVSFNLLIANPSGTATPVSDPATANNSCANTYSITASGPLPVNFTTVSAVKKGCEVNLAWKVENQVNLKKYEVEVSKDNRLFTSVGDVPAKNDANYSFAFALTEPVKAPVLYVRLKSVDADGSFRYSKTVWVAGTCDAKWVLTVFPNPVAESSSVTVSAVQGLFDGRYRLSLYSSNGQLVQQKEISLRSARSFPFAVNGISSGKYHLKVESADGSARAVLDFEKL